MELEHRAREAQTTVQDYVRTKLGLQSRTQVRTVEEREREEDDAWDRLRRIGLDPAKYFPEK